MDEQVRRDLNTTHALVNMLTAGYQGKFVMLNVFQQLGSTRYDSSVQAETKGILDGIALWIEQLMAGNPVLASSIAECGSDRDRGLHLLGLLKGDVACLADEILRMRARAYPAEDPQQTELLVASLCRHAYAREHYVKGLVAYSEKFGYEDAADRWRQHLIHTPQEISFAHACLDKLKEKSNLDQRFYVDLYEETLLLPFIFRCQVQDMNQVAGLYVGGFTFEAAGIGEAEASDWEQMGAPPETASYWHAYGFDSHETRLWVKAGLPDPGMAANYKHRDFEPAEAGRWCNAGFDARSAAVSRMLGHDDPEVARSWREAARAIQERDED